jgi:hypothetical protein
VDPVYANPTDDIFADPTFGRLKRSAKFLFSRDQWCDGRPCRLVVYTDADIASACEQYLGEETGYKADAVTVTVYGETPTATVTPACAGGDYPEYAPEETGAPWGGEGASYGDHSLEHGDDASYGAGYPVAEDGASYGEGKPTEGGYESHEGGEHGGPPADGKPAEGGYESHEGGEHGGPPTEGKPAEGGYESHEGGEHGGPPTEGKPEYGAGEHGGEE